LTKIAESSHPNSSAPPARLWLSLPARHTSISPLRRIVRIGASILMRFTLRPYSCLKIAGVTKLAASPAPVASAIDRFCVLYCIFTKAAGPGKSRGLYRIQKHRALTAQTAPDTGSAHSLYCVGPRIFRKLALQRHASRRRHRSKPVFSNRACPIGIRDRGSSSVRSAQ